MARRRIYLVDRGYTVIAAPRTPGKVQKLKNLTAVQDDLSNPAKPAGIVKGADDTTYSQIIGATDRSSKASSRLVGPASS